MPIWNEQLQQIQKLRLAHRENSEQLYATKVNLNKIETLLGKIRRKETVLPANQTAIPALQKKIAALESSLKDIDRQMGELDIISTDVVANKELISFFEKKLAALSGQVEQVNTQIAQESNTRPPDRLRIQELQTQLEKLQLLSDEVRTDLEQAKRKQTELLHEQRIAQAKKEELERTRAAIKDELTVLQNDLEDQLIDGQQNEDEIEKKRNELLAKKKRLKEAVDLSANNLNLAVVSVYAEPHPRNLLPNLDDAIPFLLMPVRMETRFVTTDNKTELWLRVYPDEIAIHTHETILTGKEVKQGEKYWEAIFHAEKNNTEDKEDLKKNAWRALASLFGSQRAAWIARKTKPLNWNDDLSGIPDTDQLTYPQHDLTTSNAWSRQPRTNVMPDKFVVMLYEGDVIVKEETGNIIRDELFVGPDPLEADDAFVKREADQQLVFGKSFDWTSNFDRAVECGMGFRISLTPAQASRGFDKIIVLGAYLSADEKESQQALESLIDNHHYSPKGFGILSQGTATNNTNQSESGYAKKDVFDNISYFVETGKPLFTEIDDCDGRDLADALGIKYDPLQFVINSDGTDRRQAVAMNTALFPSTLGYFFDTLLPVLSGNDQDKLRDFFVQHVSGRGPLPAIRVGNQPYGVLLTSDFSAWQWRREESVWGSAFLRAMQNVLNQYRTIWKGLLNEVMYVGKPGKGHSEVLMNILGLQPGSVSFFQRAAYSTDDLINRSGFKFGERYFTDILNAMVSKGLLLDFLSMHGYAPAADTPVPQLLKLVFQHYHTVLDAGNIIDNVPLSEKNQVTNYSGQKNYIHWLAETETVEALEKQDFGEGIKRPNALLYMQMRRARLFQLNKASVKWFQKNDIVLDQVLKPVNFFNIRPEGNVTKWEVMKANVGIALPDHPQKNFAVADFLLTSGNNEDEAAFLKKMTESMTFLASKSTAQLERCFTEHLDTCTYRLDAWETSLFHQRLNKMRHAPNADGQPKRREGIYLGAYGWLEDIRPDQKRLVTPDELPEKLRPLNNESVYEYADNGGFIHAPSINQATAAAVLRSGYLTHASAEYPETMTVNLSSERVRRALSVLQGIRNGQSLEALLGYQFERGLHDRGSQNNALKRLNEFIYNIRDAFPIEQHLVQQQGADTPAESIPANNVVNGVRLAEAASAFPYGATGSITSASLDEKTAIEAEKDKLEDTLDAIKDLLLSESVFQMVQGNADRTGAVMNALKEAQLPPELEVINTPRSSHFTFTNRVTIQFEVIKPGDVGYNPWPAIPMTPRAVAEPGMNKWLKKIIGEPQQLVCVVSHKNAGGIDVSSEVTMDQLKIQPIDLIYIAANELNTGTNQPGKENRTAASELESRIAFHYRQLHLLDDKTPIAIEFLKPENAAGKLPLGTILPMLRQLKSIITDSRGLHAEDFAPPSKTSTADKTNPKAYDHDELLARIQQVQATFQNYLDGIQTPTITLHEIVAGMTGEITLKDFFSALEEADVDIADVSFTFTTMAAMQVQQALVRISNFGMTFAFPKSASPIEDNNKLTILVQAMDTTQRMVAMLEVAATAVGEAVAASAIDKKVAKLIEAGKAIFGDAFNILALFRYTNALDIQLANNDRPQLLKYATETLSIDWVADEWLQSVSHIRPRLFRWDGVRTVYESLYTTAPDENVLELRPIQLPYRAKDSWIAVEFPSVHEDNSPFNITHDTLSIIVHGPASAFTANHQCGLLLDEWTETIPVKEEITGISFNYNQPNASPPQALLLTVPPVEKGSWDWDELVGIVNDTLLRAKLRAVEPALLDKVNKPETGILLPALLANFSEYDLDIALDYRINIPYIAENFPIKTAADLNG
jgi:hypothetical protein